MNSIVISIVYLCTCVHVYMSVYLPVGELLWLKTNQLQRLPRTGRTGAWLNHVKEHCLIGIKGEPKLNRQIDCDVIVSEIRETSRKPDEVYGILVTTSRTYVIESCSLLPFSPVPIHRSYFGFDAKVDSVPAAAIFFFFNLLLFLLFLFLFPPVSVLFVSLGTFVSKWSLC